MQRHCMDLNFRPVSLPTVGSKAHLTIMPRRAFEGPRGGCLFRKTTTVLPYGLFQAGEILVEAVP